MSLINQALKLEQQRRQTTQGPQAPLASRMAYRGSNDKLPLLLFGFTGMGMLLAASVTVIFYFGAGYLDSDKGLAESPAPQRQTSLATASTAQVEAIPSKSEVPTALEDMLGSLSDDQLSTVQQMLLQRESPLAQEEVSAAPDPQAAPGERLKVSSLQDLVDAFSVQGIRKAGQDTRVFLNGKIRRIGDVVDTENDLTLVGFTDTTLIFRSRSGETFEKGL